MEARLTADGFKSAVLLLDRAGRGLGSVPPRAWILYCVGTAPFVLLMSSYGSQLSRPFEKGEYVGAWALVLSLALVWMKVCHVAFMRKLALRDTHSTEGSSNGSTLVRALQVAVLFPTGLLVQALALVAVIPFGYARAFFEHALSNIDGVRPLGEVVARSHAQSTYRPRENHFTWGILFLFGLFVWLNLWLLLGLLPTLVFIFTGQEVLEVGAEVVHSDFTVVFTSFLLAWLAVDPLVKNSFAIRSADWEAERNGEDLRALIQAAAKGRSLPLGLAGLPAVQVDQVRDERTRELDQALDRALNDPDYGWRVKEPETLAQQESLLRRFFTWVSDGLSEAWRFVSRVLRDLFDLDPLSGSSWQVGSGSTPPIADVMIGLTAALALLLVVLLIKRRFRKSALPASEAEPVCASPAPDIRSESTSPDELPSEEWRTMALQLLAEGKPRLAIRALYLAGVSGLNREGLVRATAAKSVLDYQSELFGRLSLKPEVLSHFSGLSFEFERAWYGEHLATESTVEKALSDLERLLAHAKA